MELIQTALKNGMTSLSEHESKLLLNAWEIPITREKLVHTKAEAIAAAETIGYPVVLKACSPKLMHKSDSGAVHLNLGNTKQVQQAFESITRAVNDPIDGILVQETIQGQREIVLGMKRDPQFGPCVMLGLGGIAIEIFKDSVFRVAPFDRIEAMDMTRQLKSNRILGPFRGQAAVDMETLCESLMAMGNIALQHDEISEIDINPLIIDPQGKITAVDALVVLEKP